MGSQYGLTAQSDGTNPQHRLAARLRRGRCERPTGGGLRGTGRRVPGRDALDLGDEQAPKGVASTIAQ
eukprot:6075425-Heterocapsa_arctica.AAC.1